MSDVAIALGTFDGLHIGHKAVLNDTVGTKRIALTFDTPPKSGDEPTLIMAADEKNKALRKMGFEPIVLDFKSIKNLSPLEFLNQMKLKYAPQVISSGFNFRFGKNAVGDSNLLLDFCRKNKIEYRCSNPVMMDGEAVSSTRIRGCVASGDVKKAADMLDRYFGYEAMVIHGDERGRTIGFPTINQAYPKELVTPKFGVYASITEVEGKYYPSVTDIGTRPTFETDYIISETNIIDYNGNIYEKKVKVYLVDFIRSEKRFGGLDELKSAISADKNTARAIIESGLRQDFLTF